MLNQSDRHIYQVQLHSNALKMRLVNRASDMH
jgi:hypothetical protein